VNTTDFIYACIGHLTDPGFTSEVKESSEALKKPVLSAEEIAKVKEEYEEKQRKIRETKKAKEKDKDKPEETEGKDEGKDVKAPGGRSPVSHTPTPTLQQPSHKRYTLHRDYYDMRLAVHRRRRQASQAKELAPRLPGAPRGALDSV
jgi:hypothetical protein